ASRHLGSSRPPPLISPHISSDFDAIIAAPPPLPPCNAMLPPCKASRLSSDFIQEELCSTPPRTPAAKVATICLASGTHHRSYGRSHSQAGAVNTAHVTKKV